MACLDVQLEAVVRRVKNLTSSPDSRVLVFSTWTDVLEILSYALKENAIPFAFARTPKQLGAAIGQLQRAADSPGNHAVQTLLLPVKQGGNGLNLTGTL